MGSAKPAPSGLVYRERIKRQSIPADYSEIRLIRCATFREVVYRAANHDSWVVPMSDLGELTKEEVLKYHSREPRGKISAQATKPTMTQRDLSIAYTPGVAVPCLEIAANEDLAYRYTGKGNLVGVISNGTAVLGLGNIGAIAGKPVMEGKGVLMKKFADIDVFDLEVKTQDVDEFVTIVKDLTPT